MAAAPRAARVIGLNPSEQLFARLKARLRQAAKRSVTNLWKQTGKLLDVFTKQECRNRLRTFGYTTLVGFRVRGDAGRPAAARETAVEQPVLVARPGPGRR